MHAVVLAVFVAALFGAAVHPSALARIEIELSRAATADDRSRSREQDRWAMTPLRPLVAGRRSLVTALNDRAQVVGWGLVRSGARHAVLWEKGRVRHLGTLPLGGRADRPNASGAIAVNRQGDVVGTSWVEANDPIDHAFVWRNGRMRELRGASAGAASAVNDRGQVVGWFGSGTPSSNLRRHAVLWHREVATDLGSLPGRPYSEAVDINERGRVVANSYSITSELLQVETRAFLWRAGRQTNLGTLGGARTGAIAINERDEVVGSSTAASGREHAFLWRDGRMRDLGTLAGRPYSDAVDINDRGQVIGISYRTINDWIFEGRARAFIWQNGKMTDLGTLGGRGSEAVDITNSGQVVGTRTTANGRTNAFLWQNGRMIDLGPLSRVSSAAVAINDRGTVIGSSGDRPVFWTRRARR